MPLSLVLFCALGPLMALDLRLTLAGLRRGAQETNPDALIFMERFGAQRGLVTYSALWFVGLAAVAVLFPSQWALLLWACADSAIMR